MWDGADYQIDDPRPIAASAPYTFFLPSPIDILALQNGDLIKATVRSIPESAEWDAERLWFTITDLSDEAFEARLESEPSDMPGFPKGRVIQIPRLAVIDLIFGDDRPRVAEPRTYWERCLVDGAVLKGARRVEFIYREDADTPSDASFPDSGWRIRATTSGLSALEAEQATVEYVALGAVLNEDDSWLHLIDAPVGSTFLRDFERNLWVEEKNWTMFTHVTVGANDIEASRKFYDAALGALGVEPGQGPDPKGRYWWRTRMGAFAVGAPIDGDPACHANGGTIGFAAKTPEMVQAFHDAGVAAGGRAIEDPPGERQGPFGPMILAYLRDPSGNKICAMHRVG